MIRPHRARTKLHFERLEDRNLLNATLPTFDDLGLKTSRYDAHRVIVAVRPGHSAYLSAISPTVAALGSTRDLGNDLFTVSLRTGESVQRALGYFQAQSWVRYATPDYTVSLTRTPDDTSFSGQWGLKNTGQSSGTTGADIGATAAWNVTTGTGKTIVAVIDTGVDITHPDLAANIWTNPGEVAGNGRDDDRDGFVDDIHGWNFLANNNNVMDDNGHGTHVAGVIGAIGNNGTGVAGIDWHVQIMPLKFLDAGGSGSLSNAILALNYAVAHGATVSNNSYGGGGYYQPFVDAVTAAAKAGHIFVAAAGNDGINTDVSPAYPANYNVDNIISVAATDRNDKLASFSNYGARTVDLGAPGVNIVSTYKDNQYASMSGTSMATPFVTGAVALLRDLHPDWTYRQIINQILSTTDPLPALQGKTVTGGRLDLARALRAGNVTPPPANTSGASVTSATFAGATSGTLNRLRVSFSEAIDASTFTPDDIVSFTRNGQALSGVAFTVTQVSGTNNQFDVGFTTQSATGTYALTFGPNILDRAGHAMNQNGNVINGEPADRYTAIGALTATSSQTVYSPDPIRPIPNLGQVRSTLTINQDLTIARLAVKLNVTHSNVGDLRVSLISPAGTKIVLFNQRGGNGQNISTTFDDRAKTPVANGAAPYTGWFKPEQALAALAGQNARGTWTLIVEDLAAGDSGKLNSWGMMIDAAGTGMAAVKLADSTNMFAGIVLGANLSTAPSSEAPAAPAAPSPKEFVRQLDPQIAAAAHSSGLPEATAQTTDVKLDIGPTPAFIHWLRFGD